MSIRGGAKLPNATRFSVNYPVRYNLDIEAGIFDKAYQAYALNLGILGTTSRYAPPATHGVTLRVPIGS